MNTRELYEEWLKNPYFDQETQEELRGIAGDEKEIEERFYKDLEFGTGGLRGVIGAGTNRMNLYTVRRATQGFGEFLIESVDSAKEKGVVIAYDSRNKSPEFAEEAALVLCANGIKAYLFDALRTTPELSFAVRALGCAGGIVVTASHNPPEYNGYKVYGEDGGQLVPEDAEKVIENIQQIHDYSTVPYLPKQEALEKGLLQMVGEEIDKKYIDRVKTLVLRPELIRQMGKDLKVIFTPLHGTGNMAVRRVLKETGFENVFVVPEQELPDPNFTTVKSPNPEEQEAFTLALALAETVKPDVIIGTDPDCDRIGAVVQNKQGEYQILTGNQTGALLIDYILSSMEEKGNLLGDGIVVKTIVTSEMGAEIARSYGMATLDTLTGFKFIGEKIKEFEKTGEKQFIFGYEESYGYLAGTFVRDKDAVITALLICEMTAYYKTKGMTLYDGLLALFEKYGYYQEGLTSITLKGKEGMEKITGILSQLRANTPKTIGDKKVKLLRDYGQRKGYDLLENTEDDLTLPESDVLHFTMEDESWFCVRPSGTEPKIKIYFSVVGKSLEDAQAQLQALKDDVMDSINPML